MTRLQHTKGTREALWCPERFRQELQHRAERGRSRVISDATPRRVDLLYVKVAPAEESHGSNITVTTTERKVDWALSA